MIAVVLLLACSLSTPPTQASNSGYWRTPIGDAYRFETDDAVCYGSTAHNGGAASLSCWPKVGPGVSPEVVSACVSACGTRGPVRITPGECVCGASTGVEGDVSDDIIESLETSP